MQLKEFANLYFQLMDLKKKGQRTYWKENGNEWRKDGRKDV